ncbi:unnamed protein product [Toxocara canis]|uniref:MG2 domain-containing protein n=1 Tax=Toxocara canis TaxID=6265 RepID=A0A183UI65_TOXCA|nr:unnamed protein product [Toxocara canis]
MPEIDSQQPLVVVPASFRWNASNEILITPLGSVNHLVDVHVQVIAIDVAKTIYRQNLQAKIPGSTFTVTFDVPGGKSQSRKYHLIVGVQNDEKFEVNVTGRPNVRRIHLTTDKVVYRPTENVHIRALPITEVGTLYSGQVEFSLVNPDGFELVKKAKRAEGRFIATEFQLPEHLNFGEWEVVARAVGDSSRNTFSTSFDVQDYVLPPFRVLVTVKETDRWDLQLITVVARYPHGTAVSGNMVVRCEQIGHSSSAQSSQAEDHLIAQSEFGMGIRASLIVIR